MIADRAAGAIIGGLIGDALGLGCHWYYDLDEMRREHGAWIDTYTTPKPGRYHEGMKAGQLSQTGLLTILLMESILEKEGYDEADFTARLDNEFFLQIDGTAMAGPGGYTNQSIREAYQRRVVEKKPWSQAGGTVDTTEAAERAVVLSALYADSPRFTAESVYANCRLTQTDEVVVALTVGYNCCLGLLVAGEKLDGKLDAKFLELIHSGKMPFEDPVLPPRKGDLLLPQSGIFSVPDTLLYPAAIARVAEDPGITIEPAWKAALVYGLPCSIYNQLPAAYYLAARFHDDFESAVLHAINGGGQNMSRAFLTGALVGAQVGLSGIPRRFIEGLENGDGLVEQARALGKLAE